jgi:hypothetical protein
MYQSLKASFKFAEAISKMWNEKGNECTTPCVEAEKAGGAKEACQAVVKIRNPLDKATCTHYIPPECSTEFRNIETGFLRKK